MLPTLFTPLLGSPRTFSWFFLSSSLQFVFSEPLRFEHQLRSQLLLSKMVSRSIKRQQTPVSKYQTSSNSIDQGSTKQDNNKTGQDPSEGMALVVMTPGSCMAFGATTWPLHPWRLLLERSQGRTQWLTYWRHLVHQRSAQMSFHPFKCL